MDYIDAHKESVKGEAEYLVECRAFTNEEEIDLYERHLIFHRQHLDESEKAIRENFYREAKKTVGRGILSGQLSEPVRRVFASSSD